MRRRLRAISRCTWRSMRSRARARALVDPRRGLAKCLAQIDTQSSRRIAAE